MAKSLKIDFISDISCGWCAVGLRSIEEALRNVGGDVVAEFNFQPFELNPEMPVGGENLTDHLIYKYGQEAAAQYFTATRENGAAVGFDFNLHDGSRIYNTFDAHRLLHWAGITEQQTELTHALFEAHFTHNKDPGDHDVLLACVEVAKLDVAEARKILASDLFAGEVRALEANVKIMGVHAVPTIIVNDQYMISGSRSVGTFEQFLKKVLAADSK